MGGECEVDGEVHVRGLGSESNVAVLGAFGADRMGDNDQTTRWSIERMVTTGNKCIRTDYHWVKECVQLGDICPRRVSTENNISDIFTKSLAGQLFTRLRDMLIGRSPLPALPAPPHR